MLFKILKLFGLDVAAKVAEAKSVIEQRIEEVADYAKRVTQTAAVIAALSAVAVDGLLGQMDDAERQQWLSLLAKSRTSSLDAPSWLWSSVVELIALHESAYLDHCRRYALAAAA
jgi:uncharacterized protein (DUF2252 family)